MGTTLKKANLFLANIWRRSELQR